MKYRVLTTPPSGLFERGQDGKPVLDDQDHRKPLELGVFEAAKGVDPETIQGVLRRNTYKLEPVGGATPAADAPVRPKDAPKPKVADSK